MQESKSCALPLGYTTINTLSNRSLTYWSDGWISMRIRYQQFLILISCLFYITFSYIIFLRDFLFGRSLMELNHEPPSLIEGMLSVYTRLLISATHFIICTDNKMFVRCSIINMALYSLLNVQLCTYYTILYLFCQYFFCIIFIIYKISFFHMNTSIVNFYYATNFRNSFQNKVHFDFRSIRSSPCLMLLYIHYLVLRRHMRRLPQE